MPLTCVHVTQEVTAYPHPARDLTVCARPATHLVYGGPARTDAERTEYDRMHGMSRRPTCDEHTAAAFEQGASVEALAHSLHEGDPDDPEAGCRYCPQPAA